MRVGDIRRRVLEKVRETAAGRDEEATARVLEQARAVLVALAGHGDEAEVELEELAVGTSTAARILGLHPEYVRELIRRGYLPARKENGEFRLTLPEVMNFLATGVKGQEGPPPASAAWRRSLGISYKGLALWRRPPKGRQGGEQPA